MASPNTGVTMEQVFELMAKMNQQQSENFMAAIKELKKPTDREQKKIDEEEKKLAELQQMRLRVGQAEEQRKENQRKYCKHSSYNPATGIRKHAWRAQVTTPDGEKPYFIPICTQCWTQGPKILATPQMLQNGVNLDQYDEIDIERLEQWAQQALQAA